MLGDVATPPVIDARRAAVHAVDGELHRAGRGPSTGGPGRDRRGEDDRLAEARRVRRRRDRVTSTCALFTTCESVALGLPLKFESPGVHRGDRVRRHRQRAGGERGLRRTPREGAGAEHGRAVEELDRARRRVRFGAAGATVAVKVTGWPNTDGLTDDVTVVVVAAGATVKFAVFMLKKRTPAPEPAWTTMMRAVDVVTFGIVTAWAPSFGVLETSVVGNVAPPSVDSMMLTFAALIGAPVVPATFQVTFCDEPRP